MSNVPAATQALSVLRLLARHAGPLPAAAIAAELELPRSTVYHLLAALRQEGFVVHLERERRYGLGVAAFELGSAYSRQEPLRWIAQGALGRLVDATTHNGHLAVLHGRDVLWIVAAALLLTLGSTIYPAVRAARTPPAEALRYE